MNGAAGFTVRLVVLLGLAGMSFVGGSVARGHWFDAPTSPAPAAALALDNLADLTAGSSDAAVTVRIFGDYECPACRQLERTLGDTLLSLARTGAIRLVYLHRPLVTRRDAEVAAAVIACAPDRDRRWSIHRRLYDAAAANADRPPAPLSTRAQELSGSREIAECARSDSTLARARRAIAAARTAGFHEVPTVIVNDRHVRFRTLPALLRHIERALANAPRRSPRS